MALVAYGLVVCGALIGILFNRTRAIRIYEAAAASPDETPSPALLAAIGNARPFGGWCLIALMVALIAVMYLKPPA
jgi:hypothetical protein